jgi:hypothetical protein
MVPHPPFWDEHGPATKGAERTEEIVLNTEYTEGTEMALARW